MADSPLNQQIFQVPKLGQLGLQLDQVQEQKRAKKQKELQDTVEKTGADEAYMKSINTLTADWKATAEDQYSIFRDAAIEFERTGSESAKRNMQYQAGLLNHALTAGETILSTAGENFTTAKANNFDGYSTNAEESSVAYQNFVNQKIERKKTPQGVLVKEGDQWIPFQNSSYFSSELTENNTFVVPKNIKIGEYAMPVKFVDKWNGIISKSSSEQEAVNRVLKEFDIMVEKNKDFFQDVHIFHGINDRSIGEYERFSSEDLNEITSTLDDEQVTSDAVSSYREAVVQDVKARWFQDDSSTSNPKDGIKSTYDVSIISNENVSADKIELNGQYIQAEEGQNVPSVVFEAYAPLPSGVATGAIVDPKNNKRGANAYKVVGIGFIEGQPYAKKNTYEAQDLDKAINSGFSGLDAKEVIIEPLSRQEYATMKKDAQVSVATRFAEAGYDIDAWFSGNKAENSVTSQGNNNTSGLSDNEFNALMEKANAGG
jgi:hypothetical protein